MTATPGLIFPLGENTGLTNGYLRSPALTFTRTWSLTLLICFSFQVKVLSGRKKQPGLFFRIRQSAQENRNSAAKNGNTFSQAHGFIGFLKVW
jgi:hypothetical protein